MAVTDLLFAEADNCGEEIDYAFDVAGTASGARPFVMQRVKAMSRFGIEYNQVFLSRPHFSAYRFQLSDSSAFAVRINPPEFGIDNMPWAKRLPTQVVFPEPGLPTQRKPSVSVLTVAPSPFSEKAMTPRSKIGSGFRIAVSFKGARPPRSARAPVGLINVSASRAKARSRRNQCSQAS